MKILMGARFNIFPLLHQGNENHDKKKKRKKEKVNDPSIWIINLQKLGAFPVPLLAIVTTTYIRLSNDSNHTVWSLITV